MENEFYFHELPNGERQLVNGSVGEIMVTIFCVLPEDETLCAYAQAVVEQVLDVTLNLNNAVTIEGIIRLCEPKILSSWGRSFAGVWQEADRFIRFYPGQNAALLLKRVDL